MTGHLSPPDADLVAVREAPETWSLRLYVAGESARSLRAIVNLRALCNEHLAGRYDLEIIDLVAHPELAGTDDIVAVPTLIRRLPIPLRTVIGDLSNTEFALIGLRVQPART